MKRLLRAILLLWLAACGAVLAQEAPPCPCPEPPPAPDPCWFGKVNFSFLSTSGNTDTTSIGGAAELNYNPKPWLFTLKGGYLYSQTDGVVTAESSVASLRANRDITTRFYVFAGGGYLRNTFSGHRLPLERRRRRGLQALRRAVAVSQGRRRRGLDEREGHLPHGRSINITIATTPTCAPASITSGSSPRARPSRTTSPTSLDLDNTKNYFITNKAAITADISKIFALQASWTLLWRNQPVPDVRPHRHGDGRRHRGEVLAFRRSDGLEERPDRPLLRFWPHCRTGIQSCWSNRLRSHPG